jgi:hypothetical protein
VIAAGLLAHAGVAGPVGGGLVAEQEQHEQPHRAGYGRTEPS